MRLDEINELRKLESDATPGRWVQRNHQVRVEDEGGMRVGMWPHVANAAREGDAVFIAELRNRATELIDAVACLYAIQQPIDEDLADVVSEADKKQADAAMALTCLTGGILDRDSFALSLASARLSGREESEKEITALRAELAEARADRDRSLTETRAAIARELQEIYEAAAAGTNPGFVPVFDLRDLIIALGEEKR